VIFVGGESAGDVGVPPTPQKWQHRCPVSTRRTALVLLLSLSACDKAGTDDSACEDDGSASLSIDNRSGGLVERIVATPCEGGDEQELSLPSGGIEFSSQATVDLPGPGCWQLNWFGEDCTNDEPYQTSTDVCGGESYSWTISVEGRVCEGGW